MLLHQLSEADAYLTNEKMLNLREIKQHAKVTQLEVAEPEFRSRPDPKSHRKERRHLSFPGHSCEHPVFTSHVI